jgi:hypothetical protein
MECEVSPTGITGFPETLSTGAGSNKYVQPNKELPTLEGLYFSMHDDNKDDEDSNKDEMNRRFSNTIKYWDTVQDDLVSGRAEYIIPRCEKPWRGFTVPQGHVQQCANQWKLSMRPQVLRSLAANNTTPLSPLPGRDNVRRMVTLSEQRAQQALSQGTCCGEPYLVYKHTTPEIHKRVEQVQNLIWRLSTKKQLTVSQDSSLPGSSTKVVLKHVDPHIQPLVDFWNAKVKLQEMPQLWLPSLHCPLKSISTHIQTMVYWMEKKLEDSVTFHKSLSSSPLDYHAGTTLLVKPMIQLWETRNYLIKTGRAPLVG